MRTLRPTLRLRLTLLYGGLVVVVGGALLAMAAVLVDRTLDSVLQLEPGDQVQVEDSEGNPFTVEAQRFEDQVRRDARDDLLTTGALAFGVVVLVGVGAGYVLAGQALQPVSHVTATARRLSTETLHHRIALEGPSDELKELADTFDEMLGRLDAAFDTQRRFVANASHELRTPLTVIRTEVDVALSDPEPTVDDLRRMGEVVRDATRRADRLVGALLVLARTEAQERQGLEVREPVELAEVTGRAVAAVDSRCVDVSTQLEPAWVSGDLSLLDRLVGNLLENAVHHNVEGGWARLATRTVNGRAELVVENSGPVLEPSTAEELFAPFRRGGTVRTAGGGAGLGLSIVAAVASAHGGEATAQPRPDGGLTVTVRLPATAAVDE